MWPHWSGRRGGGADSPPTPPQIPLRGPEGVVGVLGLHPGVADPALGAPAPVPALAPHAPNSPAPLIPLIGTFEEGAGKVRPSPRGPGFLGWQSRCCRESPRKVLARRATNPWVHRPRAGVRLGLGTHRGVPKATKLAWLCLRVRLEGGGRSPFCCFLCKPVPSGGLRCGDTMPVGANEAEPPPPLPIFVPCPLPASKRNPLLGHRPLLLQPGRAAEALRVPSLGHFLQHRER